MPAGAGDIAEGDLAAVTEEVPEAEFAEDPLNRNMSDMAWLAPRAARHQDVCAGLMESVDAVVPLAFGTVFVDETGVRAMLRERGEELRRRLEDVRGRAEWVAALLRDAARARAWLEQDGASALAELRRRIDASPPGRGYLLARQLDEARRLGLLDLDGQAVAALHDAVELVAERAFREPLAEGAGATGMIARVSLLVRRADDARLRLAFDELAESWRPRGYDLDVTGPWPAYRFGGSS